LTDHGLKNLTGLLALQQLNLHACESWTGRGLKHLVGLRTLKRLDLQSCCNLTDESTKHLSVLTAVEHLKYVFAAVLCQASGCGTSET
jgi:hypothetical protein